MKKITTLGKRWVNYNDNYSSDESTPAAIVVNESRYSTGGKHSILKIIEEKNETIRMLELELSKSKFTTRTSKKTVQEELQWTGEETNFAEMVNHFCKYFLFPRTKFLKNRWQDFLPNKKNSLYSLCMHHLRIPEGVEDRDMWDKVIDSSISRKYQSMKCNLNNDIKSVYLSMRK